MTAEALETYYGLIRNYDHGELRLWIRTLKGSHNHSPGSRTRGTHDSESFRP